jgi:hypothetical protein
MSNKIDYLTEDEPIKEQNYVCMSFLSPEGISNCKIRGVKIRGVFSTLEEASKQAKKLQEVDPAFHVFVGEVGKWLPWDPEPDSVKDQIYREEELQKLMKGYLENQEKAKQVEQQRKQQMVEDAVKQTMNKKPATTRDRLKRILQERNNSHKTEQVEVVEDVELKGEVETKQDTSLEELEREMMKVVAENGGCKYTKAEPVSSVDEDLEEIEQIRRRLASQK